MGFGAVIVAKILDLPKGSINNWFYRSPRVQRELDLQWKREHRKERREYLRKREREAKEDLIKELGGRCQRDGRIAKAPAMTFHELFKKAREDRGRPFLRTSLGRRWIRFRKTNRREEVFGLIRRKVMLLDAACHNEVTAKEKKLGRKLLREEIHLNAGRNILR